MTHTIEERVLALAGIFQCTKLVTHIAHTGIANSAIIEASLEPLFRFDAQNVIDVYGSISSVSLGLRVFRDQIGKDSKKRNYEILRYSVALLQLERVLTSNPEMLDKVTQGIENIEEQLKYFSLMHENTIIKLGDIYQDTISTLQPRVLVNGEHMHLKNTNNAAKIRALLLAGIRSVVLWKQCGGSRWQILFSRNKHLAEVERLLEKV